MVIPMSHVSLRNMRSVVTNAIIARKRGASLSGRRAALAAVMAAGVLSPGVAAQAQTYVGNAYGTRVDADLLLGLDLLDVRLANTGGLPAAGGIRNSGVLNANANLSANLLLNLGLPILSTVLTASDSADAGNDALFASTVGAANQVTSTATVDNLTLFPSFLTINIGTIIPNLVSVALLEADVITSTTTANAGGKLGTSNIANLRLGGKLVVNGAGQLVAFGPAATLTTNQVVYLNGSGQLSATSFVGDLARLVLNRQTNNPDGSLTTDAIAVEVLNRGLLSNLANAEVVVSSSTAGFTAAPAVVPEAGTGGLLAGALAPMAALGMVAWRRRRTGR